MATSDVAAAVTAWSAWGEVVTTMNQTVNSNKQLREQSLENRKALAETTKQFKRSVKTAEQAAATLAGNQDSANISATCLAMDALSKECRKTVKGYQEEIDNLTRRCKASEQAYAVVCNKLVELPDPASLLAACQRRIEAQNAQLAKVFETVEKVNSELEEANQSNASYKKQLADLQKSSSTNAAGEFSNEEREELIQLRKEVAEYEVEFRSLKNQDITIRKLEEKILELQTAGAESIENSIAKAREELAMTEGRRAAEALEREAALEAKLQTLELQLRSERAGREATENVMLQADEGLCRREAAWDAQRQILVHDNERVRESLQTVSRERDELRMKLSALNNTTTANASITTPPPSGNFSKQDLMLERNAYEAEVSELSETNARLRDEIRMKEEQAVEEKREFQAHIDNLERQKTALNDNLASLESQLSAAPSQALVDNMRRELRILKRLEYNADDVDTDRDPEIAGKSEDENDLEAVLVAKLRKAENDLVLERNSKNELMKTTDALKKSLAEAEKIKRESDELVASLEKDLERAIVTSTSHTEPPKRHSSKTQVAMKENPEMLQHVLDPSSPPPVTQVASAPPTATATEKAEDDHSVATIVMAQRDRLRARCEALEAERDSFKRELQGQVQAAETLKSDNTKLYEKVRYLQSYNNKAGSSQVYQRGNGVDRDLDLEALEQRYEASVDPFKQFSKAERARKLGEMSPMERTVFMVAKTVLSTKEMRTGLFFYVVALHLLVFITTYHWSHAASCDYLGDNERLSHLPPALPAHIQEKMIAKDALHNAAEIGS